MPFLDEIDDADQIESAADRLAYFDDDEFGTPAQWVTSAGVAADLTVIFNAPWDDEAGLATVDMTVAAPSAVCRQADMPSGAAQGDQIFIEGALWRARELRPDQTGLVTIDLQRL